VRPRLKAGLRVSIFIPPTSLSEPSRVSDPRAPKYRSVKFAMFSSLRPLVHTRALLAENSTEFLGRRRAGEFPFDVPFASLYSVCLPTFSHPSLSFSLSLSLSVCLSLLPSPELALIRNDYAALQHVPMRARFFMADWPTYIVRRAPGVSRLLK